MNIGAALEHLKDGGRVAREGWNGKGMWLELQVPDLHSKMTHPYVYIEYPRGHAAYPSGSRVPWLASQTDLLAEDWVVTAWTSESDDMASVQLSGGGVVTPDHRDINPTIGQQKGYVVLSAAERAKGFVRPFRDAYRHGKCGKITTMSRDIGETYAREPGFYSGTFCSTCREHFPVGEDGEFTWYEMDGTEGPKVGT